MSMSTLPRAVGPLTLLRKIETDTVADVFQGTLDTLDGRPVLVRRMLPHVLRDPSRLRAIESRARDLMKVDDDRLLRTFHWVVEGTDRYLVEDMPAGVGLDSLIAWCRFAGRPVPAEIFLSIAYRISDALDALHAYGAADGGPLLHMGLAPSSITLHPGGRATLGLYALTRATGAVPDATNPPLDRSQYLSPEQTHPDRPLAPSSDIFSTGAILYELLMLEPLWSGENGVATVHAIRRGEHGAQLAAAADRVPAIDAVLDRALALDPNARYSDAGALRDDLRILLGGGTGDVEALDEFLGPLFAGITERSRPSTLVPFTEDGPTAGDAHSSWSTPKDDDDTLVRERPADPGGYSREFASAVDPTDAPDLFDEPTGPELLLDSTDTDVGEAADTQFYRIPTSPPPVADVPEPRTTRAPSPPEEPPPLWTEESSTPTRSPLRIAGWIGVAVVVLVCAGIGFGATKSLTAKKPPTDETEVATKPVPPVVAPPVVAPPVIAPPVEAEPPAVAAEPRETQAREAEPVRPSPPPREPRVVAEVEPPMIPDEPVPPRVETRPAVVAALPEPEEPPLPHETEPSPISDEDLFADLSTSEKPTTPVAVARLDMDGMKPSARDGALTTADVIALEGVTANDPAYTRSRALLLMNAQKGNDSKAVKRYLDDLMRLPENRYDPIFLTELARYYVESAKYQQAVDTAKTAEQHWARLPSELVFSKKAEMYEIQARGYTGIFFASESVDALDQAIRCWEKYRAHVATRSSDDLLAMSDKELTKLRTYRERMQ